MYTKYLLRVLQQVVTSCIPIVINGFGLTFEEIPFLSRILYYYPDSCIFQLSHIFDGRSIWFDSTAVEFTIQYYTNSSGREISY